ncbi:hypothetical protein BUALT_Bualt13G0037700 [Buddleja alternifolia]|uniref:Terpene synthase metal-binding domain-containing protein n=1 Tax=Buddleja alternifolia TaxID=168488 RepID=A0AAV6WR86_9LAMI|nr:hypothetical protein BUALT_Bualt13G0037700 [Buddleja alternifolia]
MAAIITNILIISRKPTNNLCTFDRKLAPKRCRFSRNGAASTTSSQHSNAVPCDLTPVTRRSGNYKPPFWDFDYIQSLNSKYKEERHLRRASELKAQVETLLEATMILLEPKYLIVSRTRMMNLSLFLVKTPTDCYKEKILDQAREFATIFLEKNLDQKLIIDQNLSLLVRHALEIPLDWNVPRTNARWFIEAHGKRPDMNPIVLELAKLDFNIVQAIHQEELKNVSRIVEDYIWSVGMIEPPEYGYQRVMFAKLIGLVTTVDDIFDVYGTLEELQLFEEAFQRWDIELIDQLPDYMQVCYLAVYNFINEVAYDVLNDKGGIVIIKYLRKLWTDLTRSYMQEAKWYHNGHTPTMDEYINNALISSGTPAVLTHLFFMLRNPIQKEAVDELYKYHDIVRWPSIITRLVDDIGTSTEEMERGDAPKTIQCYMNETGASYKEAQEYTMFLVREAWKKLNEEPIANSPFSRDFITCSINMGRMTHYVYLHGDGQGVQHSGIKDRTTDLLFNPIE